MYNCIRIHIYTHIHIVMSLINISWTGALRDLITKIIYQFNDLLTTFSLNRRLLTLRVFADRVVGDVRQRPGIRLVDNFRNGGGVACEWSRAQRRHLHRVKARITVVRQKTGSFQVHSMVLRSCHRGRILSGWHLLGEQKHCPSWRNSRRQSLQDHIYIQ